MINMREIFAFDFIRDAGAELVPVDQAELKKFGLRTGDLLFARQSLSWEGAGKVSIVSRLDLPTVFESHLLRARVEPTLASPHFLYYFFGLGPGRRAIEGIIQQVAAAGIRSKELAGLVLRIPDVRTQYAISAVLGALDEKIAANRSIIGGGLELLDSRFDDARRRAGKMAVSKLAQVVLGGTPSRKVAEYWGGDVPWIKSGACNSRIISSASEMITRTGLEKSAAKVLPVGTTCVAITGATLGQMGWLASSMAANQSVAGVVAPPEDRLWLHFAVRAERGQLMGLATGGAQQHVNKNAVGSLAVSYDNVAAKNFGEVNQSLMERVVFAEGENEILAATRDELLPLLISGKITVKDAEKTVEEVV